MTKYFIFFSITLFASSCAQQPIELGEQFTKFEPQIYTYDSIKDIWDYENNKCRIFLRNEKDFSYYFEYEYKECLNSSVNENIPIPIGNFSSVAVQLMGDPMGQYTTFEEIFVDNNYGNELINFSDKDDYKECKNNSDKSKIETTIGQIKFDNEVFYVSSLGYVYFEENNTNKTFISSEKIDIYKYIGYSFVRDAARSTSYLSIENLFYEQRDDNHVFIMTKNDEQIILTGKEFEELVIVPMLLNSTTRSNYEYCLHSFFGKGTLDKTFVPGEAIMLQICELDENKNLIPSEDFAISYLDKEGYYYTYRNNTLWNLPTIYFGIRFILEAPSIKRLDFKFDYDLINSLFNE